MINIQKLNSISGKVFDVLKSDEYTISADCQNPSAILVRSFNMNKDYVLPESVLAVARAGAGVNNIPFADYAAKGVVVFNTPGANANAVKELVLAALFISSRHLKRAMNWVDDLDGMDGVAPLVEKGKNQFVGPELFGKTLGVVGLGAIGRMVASSAVALGMSVVGYDPYLTEEQKNAFPAGITVVDSLDKLYPLCNYITVHVPLTPETKGFINEKTIAEMPDGVRIINCARGDLVDNASIKVALASNKVAAYVTDFPNEEILGVDGIIAIPHLGASTPEAEDNCAVMAASELKDFLENGNVKNSVNVPNLCKERSGKNRVALLATEAVTLPTNADCISNSKGGYFYAIIDSDDEIEIPVSDKIIFARAF